MPSVRRPVCGNVKDRLYLSCTISLRQQYWLFGSAAGSALLKKLYQSVPIAAECKLRSIGRPVGGEFLNWADFARFLSDPIFPLQEYEGDRLSRGQSNNFVIWAASPKLSWPAQSLSANDFKQFEYLDSTRSNRVFRPVFVRERDHTQSPGSSKTRSIFLVIPLQLQGFRASIHWSG